MAVAVAVAVAVGVGEGVPVDVAVAVGVGEGVPSPLGSWSPTVMGDPVLKKPTVAFVICGGLLASNRKLYKVPQRIAFAFGFCTKVSEFQVRELEVWVEVQAVLLNPVFPTVPSAAHPGSCAGA